MLRMNVIYLEHNDTIVLFHDVRKDTYRSCDTREERYLQPWSRVRRTADKFVKALMYPVVVCLILEIDHDVGDVMQSSFERVQELVQRLLLVQIFVIFDLIRFFFSN